MFKFFKMTSQFHIGSISRAALLPDAVSHTLISFLSSSFNNTNQRFGPIAFSYPQECFSEVSRLKGTFFQRVSFFSWLHYSTTIFLELIQPQSYGLQVYDPLLVIKGFKA